MPRHRILVADPDPSVAQVLREELSAQDYDVEAAAGSEQALRLLSACRPDVLVSELHLPELGADTLLQRVHRLSPQTKTVVVSASASHAEMIALMRRRAFSLFLKPFSRIALADMVREAVDCTTCDNDIVLLSAVPTWVAVRISSKLATVDRVVQFFREFESDLHTHDRDQMATALRELLMNAVEHGGRSDPNNKVTVTRLRTDSFVGFYIRDPGEGFSFEDLPHAAVSNPPDAVASHMDVREQRGLRPGGFGISMARTLLDGLYYNEKGNEVIMIKNLPRPGDPPAKG
jgi:two-component system, OmpR family, response regulator